MPTDILDLGNKLNDEADYTEAFFRTANHNILITDIRTSIKVRKIKENTSDRFSDIDENVWHENNLRKDKYGPFGMFKFSEAAIWSEGGYNSAMDTTSKYTFINAVNFFDGRNTLITADTSFVRVDFVTYNGHYNLFSYCYADFLINPSGVVEPEL